MTGGCACESLERQRRQQRRPRQNISTYLNSGLERQEGIARVAHLEDASKAVFGNVAYLQDLEIRGHGAQVELGNDDFIDVDGWLGRLVLGCGQQVAGALVEARVGRERRPVEVESHVEMDRLKHASRTGSCLIYTYD